MKKVIILLFGLALFSCNEPKPVVETSNEVALTASVIDADNNSGQYVTVTASGVWTATIEYGAGQTGWAALSKTMGEGDDLIRLSYTRNIQTTERTLSVAVTFASGETKRATLTQGAGEGEITDPAENDILLTDEVVSAAAGSQSVTIASEVSWTASLVYSGASGWASLSALSGTGDMLLTLNWGQNVSTSSRAVTVKVIFDGGETLMETMTQNGAGENGVRLASATVPYNFASNVAVNITSEVAWTASLNYSDAGGWASLSKSSGTGSETIQLTVAANAVQTERSVTVRINFTGGDTKSATLTQAAAPNIDPPTPTQTPPWLEMPEVALPNSGYYFVTHYTTISSKQARSFSIFYDSSTAMAYWIAYPMHKSYRGSVGRTETWDYDPKIPQSAQTNLKTSYGGPSGDELNSRGHQVASADRNATTAMNNQTYYYTNMTPQKQGFNGGIWLKLEDKIQSLASSINDTLWCVTGAIIRTVGGNESIDYITNKNDGKQVPFPNYYYKVLIRKSGSTYKGIGFWFQHFDRTKWKSNVTIADVKTIRQIEALTGYNFFYNLSEADQNNAETTVDQAFWTGLI